MRKLSEGYLFETINGFFKHAYVTRILESSKYSGYFIYASLLKIEGPDKATHEISAC
jgi:hypothetical protein